MNKRIKKKITKRSKSINEKSINTAIIINQYSFAVFVRCPDNIKYSYPRYRTYLKNYKLHKADTWLGAAQNKDLS